MEFYLLFILMHPYLINMLTSVSYIHNKYFVTKGIFIVFNPRLPLCHIRLFGLLIQLVESQGKGNLMTLYFPSCLPSDFFTYM